MIKNSCEICGLTTESNKDICQSCWEDCVNEVAGYRNDANRVITEFIGKYQTGCVEFPPTLAEDIKDACNVLHEMADDENDLHVRNIISLLNINKGIQYSKVIPLIVEFQTEVNKKIDE